MRFDRLTWLALLAVSAAAFYTYVLGFGIPEAPFWDERYYIVDAQKYLNGVYFIDLHPPLGKLLIALGEWLFSLNPTTDDFLNVTFWAETVPPGFSMVAFRVIPVMLAWMTAPVLFLIFLKILRNRLLACFLCGLYIFDNALVVHLRAAMLEGPLLFFAAVLILASINLFDDEPRSHRRVFGWSLIAGLALGCILTTKTIGVVFVLVPAGVLWRYRADRSLAFGSVLVIALSTLLMVAFVWEAHFTLARRVNPAVMSDGFYQPPSASARAFLTGPDRFPVAALPAMIGEAARYALWYDATRPTQDRCNPDDHSSSFWMWPVGGRAVPYLWDSQDEGRSYRYLYLQVNPVVWWTALAGLLAALALLVRAALVPKRPLKHPFLLPMFTMMYFAYFVPFLQIRGVVYLYHYFLPLLLAFTILAIVIDELTTFSNQAITNLHKQLVLGGWLMAVVAAFWLYKPLTYYERPLTHDELQRRNVVGLWDLRCPTCPRTDGLCPAPPP